MFVVDREDATAQAADLAIHHFDKALNDPQPHPKKLASAAIPLFGIRWNTAVLRKITPSRINKLLLKARNSLLPISDYNALTALFNDALSDAFEFPPCWAAWRLLAERFALDGRYSPKLLIPVIHWCVLQKWHEPFELANLNFAEIRARASVLPNPEIATDLWKAAILAFTTTLGSSELPFRECLAMPGISFYA